MDKSRKILRILVIGGWLLVLACAVSSPRTPDPASRHIIPFNNHGTILYVTPLVHYLVFWYIPGLMVIGAVLKWLSTRLRRSGNV